MHESDSDVWNESWWHHRIILHLNMLLEIYGKYNHTCFWLTPIAASGKVVKCHNASIFTGTARCVHLKNSALPLNVFKLRGQRGPTFSLIMQIIGVAIICCCCLSLTRTYLDLALKSGPHCSFVNCRHVD